MKAVTRSLFFVGAAAALLAGAALADEVLVDDPLDGGSLGVAEGDGGGEFVDGGGWRSGGGRLVYDAGRPLSDGYLEATMRGWTAPAQITDKSHPLNGWESPDAYTHHEQPGSFWNWRIGTGYHPFKVLAASEGGGTREEARVGDEAAVNAADSHSYRVEWRDGTIRFLFDGGVIQEWAMERMVLRHFTLGTDDLYPPTQPAPIICCLRIVDRAAGQPPPDPDPTPDSIPEPLPGDEPGSVKLPVVHDTFADPGAAAVAQGALDRVEVGGDESGGVGRTVYLRFDLTPVPGQVASASLELDALNSGGGGVVRRVGDHAWGEGTLTWDSRPTPDDEILAEIGPVQAGQRYVIELGAGIADGDGPLRSYALTSTVEDGAAYASKEHADPATHPRLVVRYDEQADDPTPPDDPDPTDDPAPFEPPKPADGPDAVDDGAADGGLPPPGDSEEAERTAADDGGCSFGVRTPSSDGFGRPGRILLGRR